MKSISEVIAKSAEFLNERDVAHPRRVAEELLAHVLGCKRIDLYLQYDRPLIEAELTRMRDGLKRCGKGEPVEYVIGEVEFYGCRIGVSNAVLIPRPETEILVDRIVKEWKGKKVWDLCCGSGCIGLALKRALPELKVVLSDLSEEALAVARANAAKNGLDVELRRGDLLEPFRGEKADVVVCNPPYVSAEEYESLDRSVKDFEPRMALVGGERGTEFYERLARELPGYLSPGAKVFLEIGRGQGERVKEIFAGAGRLEQDWAGKDRFISLEFE